MMVLLQCLEAITEAWIFCIKYLKDDSVSEVWVLHAGRSQGRGDMGLFFW